MWKTRIAPISDDSLRTQDSPTGLTQILTKERSDIACIQETNNERTDNIIIRDMEFFRMKHADKRKKQTKTK